MRPPPAPGVVVGVRSARNSSAAIAAEIESGCGGAAVIHETYAEFGAIAQVLCNGKAYVGQVITGTGSRVRLSSQFVVDDYRVEYHC
jgi:hypothetical protein